MTATAVAVTGGEIALEWWHAELCGIACENDSFPANVAGLTVLLGRMAPFARRGSLRIQQGRVCSVSEFVLLVPTVMINTAGLL